MAWLAESTQQLLDALREAGPDRGCWTWWGKSQSPQTCAAVARHQLQEVAVHTYDAQLTVGASPSLPGEVALDGVEDFLSTCCATTAAWPHEPAVVDCTATEGRSWRGGSPAKARGSPHTRSRPGPSAAAAGGPDTAYVSAEGSASELVLFMYGRVPMESLKIGGDRRVFDQLIAWDPGV